jgi:hypothetical protein
MCFNHLPISVAVKRCEAAQLRVGEKIVELADLKASGSSSG